MSLPVLAILGSTPGTKQLFALSKDGKLPFECKSIDSIKDKEATVTYCNHQVSLDLDRVTEKYVLGHGNLVEPKNIPTYYERALPKTACVFQAYQYLLKQQEWDLVYIKKSLPLVAKDVLAFEMIKILQALRVVVLGDLHEVNIHSTGVMQQKAVSLNATIEKKKIQIVLQPDAEEEELWSFIRSDRKIIFDLVDQNYEVTTILEPKGKTHHSFHHEKRKLSDSSIWDLIFKSEKSLQNLSESDWKWVENV